MIFKKICTIYEGIGAFLFVIGAAAVDSNYIAAIVLMAIGSALIFGFMKLENMFYVEKEKGTGEKKMKHKNAKRPTREQKIAIEAAGLRWENWLVAEQDNNAMTIIHKETKTRKVILC